MKMEYIPDGMSKSEWAKIKGARDRKIGKFDGTSGMKFKSRTFEDFLKKRKEEGIKYNMVRQSHCDLARFSVGF